MSVTDLESSPLWTDERRPTFQPLARDASFDVAIIGGGITGLTAAYLLKNAGKRVAVFEKGRIGDAETGHTTAHLTMVTDLRLDALVRHFGREAAQSVWTAGQVAIDTIEAIVRQEKLECQFRRVPGFLHAGLTASDVQPADVQKEQDEFRQESNLAQELGFECQYLEQVPLFDRAGIRYANQAQFHPLQYLTQLAARVHGAGVEIFEQSELTETTENPLTLKVNGHCVRCERLIIATHVPLVGADSTLHAAYFQTRLYGYSSYVVGARIPKGRIAPANFWDTEDPYHYLRISEMDGYDYAIFGGEDHKTGQHSNPEECYARLEQLLKRYLPTAQVDHRWSGQVIETNDGLPYIGPVNDEQFVATGFSGNGMTFGTLAGLMACDWVLGRSNPWQELLHVERKQFRGGTWDYIKENMDYPLHLAKGYLMGIEGHKVTDVPAGEGRVLKLHGQRCAVYRGNDGHVEMRSAICTHMGCVVRWNNTEQTWDCPCHGSRFQTDGTVLAGPAESPLAEVETPSEAEE